MEVNTPEHHTYLNLNENSNKFSLKNENEYNIINENCIDKSLDSNKKKDNSKYYINDNDFSCNLLLMPSFIYIPNKCSTLV